MATIPPAELEPQQASQRVTLGSVLSGGFRLIGKFIRWHPWWFGLAVIGAAVFVSAIVGSAVVVGRIADLVIILVLDGGEAIGNKVTLAVVAIMPVALLEAAAITLRRTAGALQCRTRADARQSLVDHRCPGMAGARRECYRSARWTPTSAHSSWRRCPTQRVPRSPRRHERLSREPRFPHHARDPRPMKFFSSAEAPIWGLLIEPRKGTDAGLVCEPPRIIGTTYPAGHPTGSHQDIDQRGPDLEHSACFSAFDLVEFPLALKGFRQVAANQQVLVSCQFSSPAGLCRWPVAGGRWPVTGDRRLTK